jgi:hypothetical protein
MLRYGTVGTCIEIKRDEIKFSAFYYREDSFTLCFNARVSVEPNTAGFIVQVCLHFAVNNVLFPAYRLIFAVHEKM